MKILYLTTHLNIGGITSYLFSLAKGLKDSGHSVYIASSGGEMAPYFIRAGINCLEIPIRTKQELSPKILFSFLKLRGTFKEKGIDVVHSNTRVTQVLGCILAGYFKKPHISTCHGFFKPRISRKLFPCWGDKVIAISDAVREHLRRDFRIKEEKIELIYNGIDTERFFPADAQEKKAAKERLNLKNAPVLGIIARLSQVKGHAYLIEAMRLVLDKVPSAQLLIVGDGKIKKDLSDLSQKLGLENNVYFLPSVKDTSQILAAIDIFVMPSLSEGLGLSLMEAMACSLAVVGSRISGIRDAVDEDKDGLLAAPKDSKELAEKILYLLSNEGRRVELGLKAREAIKNKFSLLKMVQETERVYQRCVN